MTKHRKAVDLKFSSLFPCDSEEVNLRFASACSKLSIEKWRKETKISEAFKSLIISAGRVNFKGPESSKIIDVPGDGNCLFYSLLAPLLGFVPEKVYFLFLSFSLNTNVSNSSFLEYCQ
jgi:hypothetical protein